MARNDEPDSEVTYYIPANYDTKHKLFDIIDLRGLLEGVALAVPMLKLASYLPLSGNSLITAYLVVIAGCVALGGMGYNGEYLSEFVITFFRFFKMRRVTYYNPRIKLEAKPDYLEEHNKVLLPRDRLLRLLRKGESEEAAAMQSAEDYAWSSNEIYFEDDEGYVAKPEALKTRAEKRQEREKAAELRRIERQKVKAEKKRKKELDKKLRKLEKEKQKEESAPDIEKIEPVAQSGVMVDAIKVLEPVEVETISSVDEIEEIMEVEPDAGKVDEGQEE